MIENKNRNALVILRYILFHNFQTKKKLWQGIIKSWLLVLIYVGINTYYKLSHSKGNEPAKLNKLFSF